MSKSTLRESYDFIKKYNRYTCLTSQSDFNLIFQEIESKLSTFEREYLDYEFIPGKSTWNVKYFKENDKANFSIYCHWDQARNEHFIDVVGESSRYGPSKYDLYRYISSSYIGPVDYVRRPRFLPAPPLYFEEDRDKYEGETFVMFIMRDKFISDVNCYSSDIDSYDFETAKTAINAIFSFHKHDGHKGWMIIPECIDYVTSGLIEGLNQEEPSIFELVISAIHTYTEAYTEYAEKFSKSDKLIRTLVSLCNTVLTTQVSYKRKGMYRFAIKALTKIMKYVDDDQLLEILSEFELDLNFKDIITTLVEA